MEAEKFNSPLEYKGMVMNQDVLNYIKKLEEQVMIERKTISSVTTNHEPLSSQEERILDMLISKAIEARETSIDIYKTYLTNPTYKHKIDFTKKSIEKFKSEILDLNSVKKKIQVLSKNNEVPSDWPIL